MFCEGVPRMTAATPTTLFRRASGWRVPTVVGPRRLPGRMLWGEHDAPHLSGVAEARPGRQRPGLCLRLCMAAAMALLAGCAGGVDVGPALVDAYHIYDARVDRVVVAGHDDRRGHFAEVRLSPRRDIAADSTARGPMVGTPAGAARELGPRADHYGEEEAP